MFSFNGKVRHSKQIVAFFAKIVQHEQNEIKIAQKCVYFKSFCLLELLLPGLVKSTFIKLIKGYVINIDRVAWC